MTDYCKHRLIFTLVAILVFSNHGRKWQVHVLKLPYINIEHFLFTVNFGFKLQNIAELE